MVLIQHEATDVTGKVRESLVRSVAKSSVSPDPSCSAWEVSRVSSRVPLAAVAGEKLELQRGMG